MVIGDVIGFWARELQNSAKCVQLKRFILTYAGNQQVGARAHALWGKWD